MTTALEFSRPVDATRLDVPYKIEASESERKAIAKRLGLSSLASLTGEFVLKAHKIDSIKAVRVQGHVHAELEQECVVTLEPVPATIKESIDALFSDSLPDSKDEDWGGLLGSEDGEGPDAAELIENGQIDIGELAVQYLSLALDPFPRHKDADAILAKYQEE